ncbi:MAG TPA: DEAD/DEAH box helicase, partial [Ktedonobacterales bacterium]|nr:DEAD/DEAH box helicase [Ktedonobacterales bacterium]
MPTERPAPIARPGDDDTQDDWAADLFAALDEQSEADDPDGPDNDSSEQDTLLPPDAQRAPFALESAPQLRLTPRSYQQEAVDAWLREGARGVVVLPTGAGKTVVAFDAIARLGVRTLVVVPTIELLRQWRAGLAEHLGLPLESVGIIGGGERRTGDITVITYDSAAMPRRKLDRYGLLVFDEAHHLPAQSYAAIAHKAVAPWRLGLSATLERADGRHHDLTALIGSLVYTRSSEELSAQKHIAAYREKRIYVDLTPEEEVRY